MVIDLGTAVQRYLNQITAERCHSARTIRLYRWQLGRVAAWMGAETPLHLLTRERISAHFQERAGVIKAKAQASEMTTLSSLLRWAEIEGHITRNPMATMKRPKTPRSLPIYLDEPEVRRLLNQPARDTWHGLRDFAALIVLLNTGLRVIELCNLDLGDFDAERAELAIRSGKGGRPGRVPLNPSVLGVLTLWLRARGEAATQAIFVNQFKTRLTPTTIRQRMIRYGQAAGISREKLTPHKCRHSCATLLHFRGVDIVEIQEILRHADISSTRIYTHSRRDEVRNAVNLLDLGLPAETGAVGQIPQIAGGAK